MLICMLCHFFRSASDQIKAFNGGSSLMYEDPIQIILAKSKNTALKLTQNAALTGLVIVPGVSS